MVDFPDLAAIQNRLAYEAVTKKAALLSESDMRRILSADDFADYQQAVADATAQAARLKGALVACTDEAWAFWEAALQFWKDAGQVWIMAERNKAQREAKVAAEAALYAKHELIMKPLWAVVPDKDAFKRQSIHETFDTGSIPGLKIAREAREKQDRWRFTRDKKLKRAGKPIPDPLVLNQLGFIMKTAWEDEPQHQCVPWQQQYDVLERLFGEVEHQT
ncbi:hypothetical protein [Caulobacter sp. FWC2]|uniref:hypothetical protein n=1 Tax=Caulobacter sp. FWC2 TaxID=69664 RepID=UPI000C15EC40|nr:hypothetical protein [Caulobacter sp. FWC2]PIB90978.1 hypothetical protein CSW62_04980 [Caulobacter sp. FWC2]